MKIKFKDVEKKVRQLAADNPDNRYKSHEISRCYYTRGKCSNGSIGCIFGQALEALGVSKATLVEHGKDNEDKGLLASALLRKLGIRVGLKQACWANGVQHSQDLRHSWKIAIAQGDIAKEN